MILRKLLIAALSVISIFTISGCNLDPYYGKRPFDYGTAMWVCENTSAWFIVNPDDDNYYYPKGEVVYNGQTIQVGFRFIHETNRVFIDFLDSNDSSNISEYDQMLNGECIFSPEKLVIKVDKDTDALFDGQYDTLVFIRTPTKDMESVT